MLDVDMNRNDDGEASGVKTALDGIKVVEVSTWIAGPACGVLLAEYGAEVIRVEPIGGDVVRGLSWGAADAEPTINWTWELANRSKKGIAVDLHAPEGREILHKLVRSGDVFLSNLRPAVLERAELDYARVHALNPQIVYANITGYGPRGPDTNMPSFDEIGFWARSGLMELLGEPGTPLVPLRGAMGDMTTGIATLGGIMMALFVRERTGQGQAVDVSLLGTGCWVNGTDMQAALADGVGRPRTSRTQRRNALYNAYQAGCGRWFQFAMAQSDRYWTALCQALEQPDLEGDPRFDTHEKRLLNTEDLIATLDTIVATRSREEWGPRFDTHGLVWGPALSMSEVINDPCVLENQYAVEYEHPAGGRVKGLGIPVQLSATPAQRPCGAPEYGQHTEEVLLALGYSWEQIAQLKEQQVIV
jgi:crotonobetainyl-CoA:carnitine CoA-transferase CaiB-like acyl-CoA transferase